MSITILHSPFNEASRAFLAALGIAPQGDDVTVDINGTAVRVVSNHELAAGIAGFGDYPALVYSPGEAVYVLNRPESWKQCLDFLDAPWGPEGPPAFREMTRLEFLNRFTQAEQVLLKSLESSDPTVAVFWEQYRAASSIRTDDARTIRALDYLTAQGHLAAGRKEQILAV